MPCTSPALYPPLFLPQLLFFPQGNHNVQVRQQLQIPNEASRVSAPFSSWHPAPGNPGAPLLGSGSRRNRHAPLPPLPACQPRWAPLRLRTVAPCPGLGRGITRHWWLCRGPSGAAASWMRLSGTGGSGAVPGTLPRGWQEQGPSPNTAVARGAGSQTQGSVGRDGHRQRLRGVLACPAHGSGAAAAGAARASAGDETGMSVPKDTQCLARGAVGPALASPLPRAGVAPALQRHSSGRLFCLGK